MKKKLLMGLVLLIAIGTSAVFAQKAGETVQVNDQPWVVESVSGDRMVLQRASLDGVWDAGGVLRFTMNGSTGVLSAFDSSRLPPLWLSAINNGYLKVGMQFFRNLKRTGNLTWSGQCWGLQHRNNAPDVATGTHWFNMTFTMSADGKTITMSEGSVYTRVQ